MDIDWLTTALINDPSRPFIQQYIVGILHFPIIYGSVNSIPGIKRFQSHRNKHLKSKQSKKLWAFIKRFIIIAILYITHQKDALKSLFFLDSITNRGKHAISRKVTMATRHVDNFFSEVNKCSENHDSSFISRLHSLI